MTTPDRERSRVAGHGDILGARFPALTPDWGADRLDDATLAVMANALTASGRYQVVERFERRPCYHQPDESAVVRHALFVDVETTGTDVLQDAIIQFAAVPFTYDARDGRVFTVGECVTFLEDPGRPIPAEITRLTGLTDADVRGQRIDDAAVTALADAADLVIAHHAAFDRAMLERRLTIFADKAWACSLAEVPWRDEGLGSAKLEWLAYKHAGMFYEAHRADSDCLMAVHLLATTLPSGRPALEALLSRSRQKGVAFWALGAAYDLRGVLKARGYIWSGGEGGLPKAWWREVPERDAPDEAAWLAASVYMGWPTPGYHTVRIDARNRHSTRATPKAT